VHLYKCGVWASVYVKVYVRVQVCVCVGVCLPGYSKNRLWFTHSFIPILAACMCVCKRREMTGGDEKRKQGKVREGKEKEEEVQ
jgi:hypothetical protein